MALALGLALPAQAQGWTDHKCALYREAWAHLERTGATAAASARFVAEHDAFLASGCTTGRVCPQSADERALADMLSLMAVAEGMTGSFLPFGCGT